MTKDIDTNNNADSTETTYKINWCGLYVPPRFHRNEINICLGITPEGHYSVHLIGDMTNKSIMSAIGELYTSLLAEPYSTEEIQAWKTQTKIFVPNIICAGMIPVKPFNPIWWRLSKILVKSSFVLATDSGGDHRS